MKNESLSMDTSDDDISCKKKNFGDVTGRGSLGDSPCKRMCSSIHNPIYHLPRFSINLNK